MGIEIVRGRAIGEQDQSASTRVAVVNETMARTFWPGQEPIGHHFRYGTAVSGVYGVVSYGVNQRTREIGIRMALGAQQQNILRLVILQGVKLVLAGLVLAIAVSAGLARVLESLLVDTGALDPRAYGAASLLLVAVAVMACYLPARRAMRVDPLVALRYE